MEENVLMNEEIVEGLEKTTDDKGKVVNVKKHYYGANICPSFHCKVCGHDFNVELKEEFLTTDMEDLVQIIRYIFGSNYEKKK